MNPLTDNPEGPLMNDPNRPAVEVTVTVRIGGVEQTHTAVAQHATYPAESARGLLVQVSETARSWTYTVKENQ